MRYGRTCELALLRWNGRDAAGEAWEQATGRSLPRGPPAAASSAATPRRRRRADPDSDPGARLHGRGGPPAGAIRRPGYRNSLSNSPCPLGRARGRGPILSALTSMRRWCQGRTVLYWWPDYGRQRGIVARLSPRVASGFLHVVAYTRRGRCWRCQHGGRRCSTPPPAVTGPTAYWVLLPPAPQGLRRARPGLSARALPAANLS